MTYRSIFVHIDDSTDTDRRLDIATRLARTYPAELVGTYLLPGLSPTPFTQAMMASEIVRRRIRQNADDVRAAEAKFRAAAAAAGVTSISWRSPAGDPFDVAVHESRYSDLTVLGQPSRDQPDVAFHAELANAVLMGSGRPVLFVPFVGVEKTLGERILIAWKDSRESGARSRTRCPFSRTQSGFTPWP